MKQQFVKTRFFDLIKESIEKSIPVSEWEKAYESFADTLFAASAKLERAVFRNSLHYAKAELLFLQQQLCLKNFNGVIIHPKSNLSY